MKKLSAIAVFLLFPVIFSYAQYEALNLKWQKCFGGSGSDVAKDILPLPDGGFMVVGESTSNDGDVSGHHGSITTYDGWIVRLSSTGDILWQKSVGGSNNDYFKSVIKTADGNFVAVGSTHSSDGDVSASSGIWVTKFSPNGNLLWSKCPGSGSDTVGNIVQVQDGGYVIVGTTLVDETSPSSYSHHVVRYLKIDKDGNLKWRHDVGDHAENSGEDIRMLPDGSLAFSALVDIGGVSEYFPMGIYDQIPWIVRIDQAGNVLKKYRGGDNYLYSWKVLARNGSLMVSPYGITILEYGLDFKTFNADYNFSIHLSKYNSNNKYPYIYKTSGVHPRDPVQAHQIIPLSPNAAVALPDSMILITGQWQLPDNDTSSRAFIIRKTFKQGVQVDTLIRYFGGSRSDAFVSIKPINNTEYVVAGFTHSNDGDVSGNHGGSDMWIVKMTDPLPAAPPQAWVMGLEDSYCINLGKQSFKIYNLPGGKDTTASAKLDDQPLVNAADSTCSFTLNTLASGQHTIDVVYSSSTSTSHLKVPFTVLTAPTPEVTLMANISSRETDPAVITANNKNGGGSSPYFTFAKDRDFVQIIRNKSLDSILTIKPADLSIGNNWIYVQMATTLTCYTSPTAIDSINIYRPGPTGIIDPENPAQEIQVYPNPFESDISINGLSLAKEYRFSLYSQDGKMVVTKRIKNRSIANLDQLNLPAGIYMLFIYDETKKRSLGVVKVLKHK